jgi:hypothetical protein
MVVTKYYLYRTGVKTMIVFLGASEPQANGRTSAGRLRDINRRAVGRGNLANEPQSDTAALTLGRDKGQAHEYLVALIGRDPWAIVRHRYDHSAVRMPQ